MFDNPALLEMLIAVNQMEAGLETRRRPVRGTRTSLLRATGVVWLAGAARRAWYGLRGTRPVVRVPLAEERRDAVIDAQ